MKLGGGRGNYHECGPKSKELDKEELNHNSWKVEIIIEKSYLCVVAGVCMLVQLSAFTCCAVSVWVLM